VPPSTALQRCHQARVDIQLTRGQEPPLGAQELARDVVVIADRSAPMVPDIGVIGGTHAVLVVSCLCTEQA
jgi:hypothetical protein